MNKKIEVYSTTFCPYCSRAKMILKAKKLEFTETNLDKNPESREEMLKRSNGSKTVPQIFIDNNHIGGCDELEKLERSGELETILNS